MNEYIILVLIPRIYSSLFDKYILQKKKQLVSFQDIVHIYIEGVWLLTRHWKLAVQKACFPIKL